MATVVEPEPRTAGKHEQPDQQQPADVLVVFGITGDLAKVMTFHSLYRLEARGLLSCPIVGVAVDDWSAEDLRKRARDSIEACGESIDDAVFERFAARLSYVSGDFADAGTFQRVASAIKGAHNPVFYLEIPPFLFGKVIKGLADAGLTEDARVVVEKPFGHDLESARALADEIHEYIDGIAALPDRPLPREDGAGRDPLPAVREHDVRADLEPEHVACVQITMAEDFGVDDRGHFYDPVGALRDVVVNHLMQVVAAAAMEPPAAADPDTLKDSMVAVFRSMRTADVEHYVRGQYDGYRASTAVPTTRPQRPTRRSGWRSTTGAGRACPSSSARASDLPATQTELRVIFHEVPRLAFAEGRPGGRSPTSSSSSSTPRPASGSCCRRSGVTTWLPSRSTSTWSSRPRAARARPRTRCCCSRP